MLKSLKFDIYKNGYNASKINCIDIPIAGASGYYNYENYFYYCFYYSMFTNWTNIKNDHWLTLRNEILKKIGLTLVVNKINAPSQLIPSIKSHIDNMQPLILIAKYNSLFYSGSYLNMADKGSHGIIISGYDTERPLIIVRESVHIDNDLFSTVKVEALAKFQITDDILLDIWNKTNTSYREENSPFYNTLYSIEKTGEPCINNYKELLDDFLNNFDPNCSKLAEVVNSFNDCIDNMKSYGSIELLRRIFYGSITVLFEILAKAIRVEMLSEENQNRFNIFTDEYKKFRYFLLSKLHAQALRNKPLNITQKEKFLEEIHTKDNELIKLIKEFYSLNLENLSQNKIVEVEAFEKEYVNYALGAVATADSEYNPNPDLHYRASQAVNGKYAMPEKDMWISTDLESIHWLKVDLGQARTINKFIIKHAQSPVNITVDFTIQGSSDSKRWQDLVKVKGNDSNVTTHDIAPSAYRYFRLYITGPALNNFCARIYGFEAWGCKQMLQEDLESREDNINEQQSAIV